jgi:hypothetical protein
VKRPLKGTHFLAVDEVKSKKADILNVISADGLNSALNNAKFVFMVRYGRKCVEGDTN